MQKVEPQMSSTFCYVAAQVPIGDRTQAKITK